MSYSAELDFIHLKTGTTLDEFKLLAIARQYIEHSELMHWLKSEFELEHGHATMISHLILPDVARAVSNDQLIARQFRGSNKDWLAAYNELLSKVRHFGHDVSAEALQNMIALQRKSQTFALLRIANHRMYVGINLPNAPYDETYNSAQPWTELVSHSVTITLQQQINDELVSWLKAAYARAS